MRTDRTYSESEIRERLATLPGWVYADGELQRIFRTAGFKSTLMVTMAVGHLCEAAWHHPEMVVSFNRLVVKLSTHSANGITDKDFELAALITEVIGWRPGEDGGALEGTPSDPRHAYLHHE